MGMGLLLSFLQGTAAKSFSLCHHIRMAPLWQIAKAEEEEEDSRWQKCTDRVVWMRKSLSLFPGQSLFKMLDGLFACASYNRAKTF